MAAKRALKVTRRTSFMLSGAQLGITVTGLLVGFVAEPFIGESLGVLLGGAGVPAAVGITVGTVLALVLATVVQMIFGELFPKNLAIANPEPLARGLARSTLVYLTVFGWLITFFDKSSNAAAAAAARRARPRRRQQRDGQGPRAHHRATRARAATCPMSCRCCWTASSTSRSGTSSTR